MSSSESSDSVYILQPVAEVIVQTINWLGIHSANNYDYVYEELHRYPQNFGVDLGFPQAGDINIALSLLERAYFCLAHEMNWNWMHNYRINWVMVEQLRQNYMYISERNRRLPPPLRHEDRQLEFPYRLGAEARAFRKRLYDEGRLVPDRAQRQERASPVHYSLRPTRARTWGPGYFDEDDSSSDESYVCRREASPSDSPRKRRRI